jgi:putative transposase
VVALEIAGARPAADSSGPAAIDATIAAANRTWGEERIAAELLSEARDSSLSAHRTTLHAVGNSARETRNASVKRLLRNHAGAVFASDFFVVVTATFRVIYVFVVLEIGTRRILHWNVTEHPTADWTAQQFRMMVPGDQGHRFVIHDRDTSYAEGLDRTLVAMGLEVLQTPARVPQANAFCERVIGTIRRECLDFVIPMTEHHLRAILREWDQPLTTTAAT